MINFFNISKAKISLIPVLIALGIVYGDIGTSPLYVMRAIMSGKILSSELVYGAVSCVFWTLTLQTSLKYIIIVLSADRQGQGGMLTLYSLIKRGRKKWWIVIFAMVGASLLLSEGIITPAISVSSAIEGLRIFSPDLNTVPIVMTILAVLFAIQRFGTTIVGTLFGPIMLCWFSMIGFFGFISILDHPEILSAINPIHAFNLLFNSPIGILILGAVFLCTTGAEALYSDMGHCDRKSIRRGWAFVKICLLLNYFGQGAWLIGMEGEILQQGVNPFFAIIPNDFLLISIIIATMATVIASQALITGSFSLINEASRLNIFPKLKTKYPTKKKAQIYIPFINNFLFIGCIGIVYYFKESHNMEAAYGLSVVSGMMCTTILFCYYLISNKFPRIICLLFVTFFLTIELHFFVASIYKFFHGGWIVMMIASAIFCSMWFWMQAKSFRKRNIKFIDVDDIIPNLIDLSNDRNINKVANHIVYLTSSKNPEKIENKITYSLFENRPKRANIYWFVHVNIVNQPFICDYKTTIYSARDVARIDFNIGFKIQPRIGLFFDEVLKELIENKEIKLESNDEYEKKVNINGDVKFIIWKKFISNHHYLDLYTRFITSCYDVINKISVKEDEFYGLDDKPNEVEIERVPINLDSDYKSNLTRI
ncbi:MAG: KUP system potassium uptake protein [Rickettsiales bacterium]